MTELGGSEIELDAARRSMSGRRVESWAAPMAGCRGSVPRAIRNRCLLGLFCLACM